MRFLIAGLGSIGRRHLHNLLTLGQDDVVLYRTHRGTLPEDELSVFPSETDLEAALAHKPDAVIVSNPTALHLSVAIPAARRGCHIFLEKPVSHTLDGLDELQQAAVQSGSRIFVGFQFRFHPALQTVKRLLAEGAIGKPLWVHAHWGEYLPGWHPWEDYRQGYSARQDLGGGVLLTLCHPLDYLTWLFGKATAVLGVTEKLSELELSVEDTAEVVLTYAGDFLATVHLDYVQRPPQHHLEIAGSQGSIRWNYADGSVMLYPYTEGESSVKSQQFHLAPGFERNDMFLAEMRHFVEVVQGKSQPACTLEDGIFALQLALAAKQSSLSGMKQVLTPVFSIGPQGTSTPQPDKL
ncbi:MAG: Gfo/Idh/MocA family protein [Chloroflexota bacterium]